MLSQTLKIYLKMILKKGKYGLSCNSDFSGKKICEWRCKYIREILKNMPDIKYMILKCHAFTFMYKLYTYIYF